MARLWMVFVLGLLPALAQPPRSYWAWWDSPIRKDLNLTPVQNQQIRMTVKEYRDKLLELRTAIERAEADVADALDGDVFDQARANTAVERLAAARGEMLRTFSQLTVQLRAVLTTVQWRELQRQRPPRPAPGVIAQRPGPAAQPPANQVQPQHRPVAPPPAPAAAQKR